MVRHISECEMSYYLQLGAELLFTGLTAIPLMSISSRISKRPWVATFVGAAAYHLLSEASGLNEWYIFHGAAALRNENKFNFQRDKKELQSRTSCQVPSQSSSLVRWPTQATKPTSDSICVRYPPAK